MRFRNITSSPLYCGPTSTTILTGRLSREVTDLAEVVGKLLNVKGFDILPSQQDEMLLEQLQKRFKAAKARNVKALPGINDPTGHKRLDAMKKAEKEADDKAWADKLRAKEAFEASHKDKAPEDRDVSLVPKRIEGKPVSLGDIQRHNAALGGQP